MQNSTSMIMELLPRWNRFVGRAFKATLPEGVNPPMHHMLTLLCKEPMSMTLMARKLRVTKQQMTVIADKAIAMNMVRRINDPNDRRVILLEETQEGKAFLDKGKEKMSEVFGAMFEEMTPEIEQRFRNAISELNKVFIELENTEKENKGKETD